jgi:amidase
MTQPLNELTATEIVSGIRSDRFTAEAVMRACLERIDAREPEVAAWAFIDPDMAIQAARNFDRAGRPRPLGGVPFGVKDIIDTADMPTEWNSPIHKGRQAGRDAACVALSRKAGGILLGKAVTTELANRRVGPTRNPRDLTRTPGGSSSGSAAAVADFMVPLAIGTQTTGSTIRPSSFCGIVGYRPTWGEHRLHGVMEASGSLDTLGICARSVDDVALYRDSLLDIEPQPVAETGPPRIGFCRTHIWPKVTTATQKLVEDAAVTLAKAGATIVDVELPAAFAELTEAHRWISSFEFARTFTWEIENHRDRIAEPILASRVADGASGGLERYVESCSLAERLRLEMDTLWRDYDVLMTPGATDEAPVGWDAFAGADLYKMWTALHVPAITLPVFQGPNGMPIGLQFFAKRHHDRALFSSARWAHRALS